MHSSIIPYKLAELRHSRASITIETDIDYPAIDLTPIDTYNIFPVAIMNSLTEWNYKSRTLSAGDTIVQQLFLPPLGLFSLKVICGVRIKEVINEPHRRGFSYETLIGHVEKGISTFTLEHIDGKIIFVIETVSMPGNFLVSLFGSLISRPYQAYCTRRALRNVKALLEAQGK